MANEIRNTVRRNRRGGVGIALALSMMALLAWFVLPSIAASGDPVPIPPGSSQQFVTPQVVSVGGTTFGCGTVGSTATAAPIVITNPKNNGVYSAPGNPNYKITLRNVTKTTANWTASGGIQVVDLGVNGGSQTAWYRYRTPRTNYLQAGSTTLANGLSNDFGVTSDNGVHATQQSPGNLYNLSIMTFCYVVPNATVSGYVYRDSTGNGSKDASETAPSAGWAVRAYANAVLIGSAPVDGSGAYSLTVPPATDLRLCAVRPTDRWVQVEPSASATLCTGSNELGNGPACRCNPSERVGVLEHELRRRACKCADHRPRLPRRVAVRRVRQR